MKWHQQRQFEPVNRIQQEVDELRTKIIALETTLEDETSLTDKAIGLLNAVYTWFERNHPTVWAELPLGIQTRVLFVLGDITDDEIFIEQGEQ